MKIIQTIITTLLPASLVEEMKRETNQWQIRCLGCSRTKLLWEAGGIRYKKKSAGSVTLTAVRCRKCGGFRKALVERVEEAEGGEAIPEADTEPSQHAS